MKNGKVQSVGYTIIETIVWVHSHLVCQILSTHVFVPNTFLYAVIRRRKNKSTDLFFSKLEHDNPKSVQCWASTNLTNDIWKMNPRGSRPNFCWYVDEDKLELKHVRVNLAINVSLVYNGSIFRLDCKILYDQS